MKFGLPIRLLAVLTVVLGAFTVLTISSLGVPGFIITSAIVLLGGYVVSLGWMSFSKQSRIPVYLVAALSLVTMASTFSSSAHLELIESGYLPAIFIIFAGFGIQALLFAMCVLALRSERVGRQRRLVVEESD